jgi:preprotein translocase subunit SecE
MVARVEPAQDRLDGLKWLIALACLAAGVAGYYFLSAQLQFLRVVVVLAGLGLGLFVAVQTDKGRRAWEFVRESRTEVRKVVWPNRRETLQTTGLVLAMVTLVALILWALDGLFGWIVRALLRG